MPDYFQVTVEVSKQKKSAYAEMDVTKKSVVVEAKTHEEAVQKAIEELYA